MNYRSERALRWRRAYQMARAGATRSEISAALGITPRHVGMAVKRGRPCLQTEQHRRALERTERVVEAWLTGQEVEEIAAAEGCSPGTVRRHLRLAAGRIEVGR